LKLGDVICLCGASATVETRIRLANIENFAFRSTVPSFAFTVERADFVLAHQSVSRCAGSHVVVRKTFVDIFFAGGALPSRCTGAGGDARDQSADAVVLAFRSAIAQIRFAVCSLESCFALALVFVGVVGHGAADAVILARIRQTGDVSLAFGAIVAGFAQTPETTVQILADQSRVRIAGALEIVGHALVDVLIACITSESRLALAFGRYFLLVSVLLLDHSTYPVIFARIGNASLLLAVAAVVFVAAFAYVIFVSDHEALAVVLTRIRVEVARGRRRRRRSQRGDRSGFERRDGGDGGDGGDGR